MFRREGGGNIWKSHSMKHFVILYFLEMPSFGSLHLLISERQASSGIWLKFALSLLELLVVINIQYPTYDVMIKSISSEGEEEASFPPPDETLYKYI